MSSNCHPRSRCQASWDLRGPRAADGTGITVDQHHTAPFLAEQKACRCADAARATSDDRNFVFKSPTMPFSLSNEPLHPNVPLNSGGVVHTVAP